MACLCADRAEGVHGRKCLVSIRGAAFFEPYAACQSSRNDAVRIFRTVCLYGESSRMLRADIGTEDDLDGSSHMTDVVVIGFGPTAQLASMPLMDSQLKVTVID